MAKIKGTITQVEDINSDIAISVSGVSKSFRLPHNRQNSLKGTIVNLIGGGDRTFETQEVLKDISFEIKKGEFFGIVGRNGSGKSTLLKMLAGIYKPTHGNITVNGSLTPFIELGVGFNPELTGRENVYLNGALLGFNYNEVDSMYADIVKFAEIERFMDQKLKNYSSGMQVRLAFSIAIRARSDILLLDEVLAVGDEAFQRKCYDYFETLRRNKKTVILVTHDMGAVERFCSRAFLVKNGKIVMIGDPKMVSEEYSMLNSTAPIHRKEDMSDNGGRGNLADTMITGITTARKEIRVEDPINLEISIDNSTESSVKVVCGINVHTLNNPQNEIKVEYNSFSDVGETSIKPGEKTVFKLALKPGQLTKGSYLIRPHVLDVSHGYKYYVNDRHSALIDVVDANASKSGSFNLLGKWEIDANGRN